jgi:DNA helicase II / ATP-dependent DNA helicase PcrA
MESMLDLNPPQATAVLHGAGPLLVFAGAGSGKTRVITYRIARLLAEDRVPPYRILAVTFTNKAAGEMQRRLAELAGEALARDLWVGTFHALSARLLRRYGAAVGLTSKFVIYDDSDQKALLTRVLREGGYDEKNYAPKLCQTKISHKKRDGITPHGLIPDSNFDANFCAIYARYEQALGAADAVDFDDLILKMVQILEPSAPQSPEAASATQELRARFDYLLVDEFQDTNAIQYTWVRALSARTRNLCVVGDDDQSIYSWRGADVRNIRDFARDFPDAQVVKLEQNYRSSGNIVAAARGVITAAPHRTDKAVWTDQPAGEPVRLTALPSERDEARYVVDTLKRRIATGLSPREIAIFYRVNAQSRVLEEGLRQGNVPYQVVGGMRFFERAEIKNLLAYLRLLENPRSDADLIRIFNVPTRGLGDKTQDRLLADAAATGTSVFVTLERWVQGTSVTGATKKRLESFYALLRELLELAQRLSPSQLADQVIEKTGYRALLREENNAEADARLENLAELVGSIEEYELEVETSGGNPTLAEYLERVALVSDVDSVKADSAVLLMTVHSAKGLEFDTVFLTGMEEETFPYRGLESENSEELAEERRLAYVAVTRARRHLFITHAATRTLFGQTRYLAPSRFLADIPGESSEQHAVTNNFGGNPAYARPPARQPAWRSGSNYGAPAYSAPGRGANTATAARPKSATPGQRVVDTQAFQDLSHSGEFDDYAPPPVEAAFEAPSGAGGSHARGGAEAATPAALKRGMPVFHQRFGHGIVERLEDETKVIANFKGYGSKRVLSEYLSVPGKPAARKGSAL